MAQSSDRDHFFQTSESIAANERRSAKSKNKAGDPIDLKAKSLGVLASEDGVFVACADGAVRRIDLDSHKVAQTFTGPTAPLTSITLGRTSKGDAILFAGCWDKSIHSWSVTTGKLRKRFIGGHTDFVKCLSYATIQGEPVLITGSADAKIIVWQVETGKRLHTLTGHVRGVLDLAIDPTSPRSSTGYEEIRLFSADSVRDIKQWTVTKEAALQQSAPPISAHQTSVNRLRFEESDAADDDEADLWTASLDKTAKHLVRSRGWEADTVLEHPDFVKDVVVAGPQGQLVATACRDEEVRVWDASSGKLICIYTGHFDEVTGLAVVDRGKKLISVSLDGTLRQWSLDTEDMKKTMEEREKPLPEAVEEEKKEGMMTAEEEAELADLMDSD
ncbi:WD40-repeat-containing domain protein [Elsinoe ampelina]|uniref:WD40-repeat-containing domain protein n=1 Tax=Elsinoe ampelina TaxID=302913 RepID=A0A6A6GCB9_9PEZI|nr:WD40-repeat-containing domain protein [Elsinoe ampelina]